MAEAGHPSEQDVGIETMISCSICLEPFTRPKLLPCLHAFCAECLHTYAQTFTVDSQFPCPECRKSTLFADGGVAAFKDLFFMNSLMDTVLGQASTSKCALCAFDGNSVPAEAKCIDCSDYLCQSCTSGHHKSRLTRDHKVVKLDDIKSGRIPHDMQAKKTLPCADHPDEHVRYYCVTCEKLICRDCQVLSHKTHECESFDLAARTRREILDEELNKLELVTEIERKGIQRQIKRNAELTKIIETTFKQLISQLEQMRKKALDGLQPTVISTMSTEGKARESEVLSDLAQLERYGKSLKMLLTKATDVEILDTFQTTKKCVQHLSERTRPKRNRRQDIKYMYTIAREFKQVCLDVLEPLVSSSGMLSLIKKIPLPTVYCGRGITIDNIGNVYNFGLGKALVFGPNKTWRDVSCEVEDIGQNSRIQFVTSDGDRVFFLNGEGNTSKKMTIYEVSTKEHKTVDLPKEFDSPCACVGWDDTLLVTGKGETGVSQVSMNGEFMKKFDTDITFESCTPLSIAYNEHMVVIATDSNDIAEYKFDNGDVDDTEELEATSSEESIDASNDTEEEDNHSDDIPKGGLKSVEDVRFDRQANAYVADIDTNGIYFSSSSTAAVKILGDKDGIVRPVGLCLMDDQLLVYHEKGIWIYHITHLLE